MRDLKMDETMADLDHSSQMETGYSLCKNSLLQLILTLKRFRYVASKTLNTTLKYVVSNTGCGSETSQLSLNSLSTSQGCMRKEASQPEEEDHELEKTLSSHGSTLLDVYPSMLNQIGKAYQRQHVTDVASAVLRRYRHRRLQSFLKQHRNHDCNNSLNTTKDSSMTVAKPPRKNIANQQKNKFNYKESLPQIKNKQDFSPLKRISNTPSGSTACFFSPRRDDVARTSEVEHGSRWTGQRSNGESPHRPIRVLDLSTPPSSSSRSPSPDLNQTYVVEPVPLPRSQVVPPSSVCGSTWSPLKMARFLSHASQGGSSVHSSPSLYRSGLRKDHNHSITASPQRALSSHVSQLRSPLKARIPSLDHNQQTSLSSLKPVIHTTEMHRSPYKAPKSFSPHHQETVKHQTSFSRRFSPSTFIPKMPSAQIDAEFMRLYHHFICRSTNPTSSCHMCKMRSVAQSPAMSSKSMSALSLTPVRRQKRHREPEVVELLRFKRFRESCSPCRTTQFWPKQQPQQQEVNRHVKTPTMEPSDDKYTWNRALLLQCPSPGFLNAIRQHKSHASGSGRKGPGSRLDLNTTQYYSPSWRDSVRYRGDGENFERCQEGDFCMALSSDDIFPVCFSLFAEAITSTTLSVTCSK
ncbi:hypothetical protein C0J50_16899 [Silurus asotus]|uniref:Uncharacterized protein n=1 Tax=Silurus asotus TaxID=30991 RepID=A0AAD5FNH4_SILAS|nr:hypothetical protein C0J50_16899 [Silurus asotus]